MNKAIQMFADLTIVLAQATEINEESEHDMNTIIEINYRDHLGIAKGGYISNVHSEFIGHF